jgi:hypothetical protein
LNRAETINILTRLRDIDGEVKFSREIIADIETQYYEPRMGGGLDGMPRAKGGTSSPTENAALNIPESASQERRAEEARIEALCAQKKAIMSELDKLELVEKNVVYSFYIRRLYWTKIASQNHFSVTQCKKIRNRALAALGRAFGRNAVIKAIGVQG